MFFLVTGASGAGKSTVRRLVEKTFDNRLETAELATLGVTPEWNLAWRHRMVERLVRRAIQAQRDGRSFLLCGDPVPPGELLAAPSADQLDTIAVCLLDVSEVAQCERLTTRGDDPTLLPQHVAFADWMRGHAADPGHRPEVIMQGGWEAMRWDRWVGRADVEASWSVHVIDTTARKPAEVAALVEAWIRSCLGTNAAVPRRGEASAGSARRSPRHVGPMPVQTMESPRMLRLPPREGRHGANLTVQPSNDTKP